MTLIRRKSLLNSSTGWSDNGIGDRVANLLEREESRFRSDPRILYAVAEARRDLGEQEAAQTLADHAFGLSADEGPELRLPVAFALGKRGQLDWAEREYRESIKQSTPGDLYGSQAAFLLSMLLHDQLRNEEAAQVLEQQSSAIEQAGSDDDEQQYNDESSQEDLAGLRARAAYYRACFARSSGDRDQERHWLQKAIQLDPDDIDVMIALFRLPEDDSDLARDTRKRIEEKTDELQAEIERFPMQAGRYNNLAWLVANTTGDRQQALKYAEKAVELADTDSLPGHLDTLARCHFAVGNLDEAVKFQKKAVELQAYSGQLKRQLEEFELARKNGQPAS